MGKNGTTRTRNDQRSRGDARVRQKDVPGAVRQRIEAVIQATLLGKSIAEISDELGIAPTTVRNLRQRSDYREELDRALTEQREAFKTRLTTSAGAALATQIRAMANATSWRDRIDAANSILDRAGISRVTKTEAKVEGFGALAELMAGACETED